MKEVKSENFAQVFTKRVESITTAPPEQRYWSFPCFLRIPRYEVSQFLDLENEIFLDHENEIFQ